MVNVANQALSKILQVAMVLLCVILVAFNEVNGASVLKLPSKESKFDGLYGIKVKKGIRCEKCCDLVFPETFGLGNMRELKFLKEVVNSWSKIERDLDCVTSWSYDALDHFKYLATVRQDKNAAKMLLYPAGHGGFDLGGGELDEVYPDEYIRPVVEKYKKLGELLNVKVINYIADELCLARVNPVIDSNMDLEKMISDLRSRGLKDLANKLEVTCKAYESKFK